MTRTIATTFVALSMLSAPMVLAGENPVRESRAKIETALGKKDIAPARGQVSQSRTGTTGGGFFGLVEFKDTPWADNYRGGRKHPPSGR